jgi:neutral trehalase
VVTGGRFRELYYWDFYFTMLGLVEDGYRCLAEDMLRRGFEKLAHDIASPWLDAVHRVCLETVLLLEKYDVAEFRSGGGEYATQDGFGWTNASYVTLRKFFSLAGVTETGTDQGVPISGWCD